MKWMSWKRKTVALAGFAISATMFLGCAGSAPPVETGDDRDASFLTSDAKADNFGISAAQERGVLAVANSASLEELDVDAGLDIRAARGIVHGRAGSDGVDGTADDRPFSSLRQLDAIPWVGPEAFDRLLEYAELQGLTQEGTSEVHGIDEGSALAGEILDVVNVASVATLDEEIELDSRAATNIVAYRLGADAREGTADDRTFDTLYELDQIRWVGAHAFGQLRTYVHSRTSVTASAWLFDNARRNQPRMTEADALQYFGPNESTAVIGTYSMHQRTRECHELTGCEAWSYSDDLDVMFERYWLWERYEYSTGSTTTIRTCESVESGKWSAPTGPVELRIRSGVFQVAFDGSGVWCSGIGRDNGRCMSVERPVAMVSEPEETICAGNNAYEGAHQDRRLLANTASAEDSPTNADAPRIRFEYFRIGAENFWGVSRHRSDTDDGHYRETEYVLWADFR